ncbi:MAG: uroporphyrinogen-III synthase [Alcanivorax sp.]|nr:uroporphyrinogen-III synthase [Alcanivorax sp.]
MKVLVTRPAGQAGALCQQLQAVGFTVQHQPALEIEPLPVSAAERRLLMDLDHFHAVCFTSANAARLALDAMSDLWPQWPVGLHWLAVGRATAAELQRWQLPATVPAQGFNSEALLALPCLQHLQEKRVLLCRGEGGRALLEQTLRERGAEVLSLVLYRRRPAADFAWPTGIDALMVTSVESWQAMADVVPASCLVVVAGDRVAQQLRGQHDGPMVVADSAHDADMVRALQAAGGRH